VDGCEVGGRHPVAQDSRLEDGNALQNLTTPLPAYCVSELMVEAANWERRVKKGKWEGEKKEGIVNRRGMNGVHPKSKIFPAHKR